MPNRVAQSGDCVESIADEEGFFWQTVWNFGPNADLSVKRESHNILEEGDIVWIPEKESKTENCALNQRHRFRRRGVPSKFNIRLLDDDGKPRDNLEWKLVIDEETTHQGITGKDGWIRTRLAPGSRMAKLMIVDRLATRQEEAYDVLLGTMPPINTIAGAKARLFNLGFYEGEIDATESDEFSDAVSAFQEFRNLDQTGKVDGATRSALRDLIGS